MSLTETQPSAGECRQCGTALPPGSPPGHCPRCLCRVALFPDESGTDEDASTVAGQAGPWAVLGDCELFEELGRGGMGIVYRARHRKLGRVMAVKVLRGGELAEATARRRFQSEAETAAQLQHPGIVTIHDVGEEQGVCWYSMELVPGRNLDELVRHQPMEACAAAVCLRGIADAVIYAHGQGVLHRDLKPSNIILDAGGSPRVTDFGIARRTVLPGITATGTGAMLVSPGYGAPEQSCGGETDVRTDVYGLGGILYHLLTGRPPFQGPTPEAVLMQVRENDPLSLRQLNPSVPRDLETICLKCLAREPARRYQTAGAVDADLARFLEGRPIMARPAAAAEKVWRWCRRRPALAAALFLLAVVTAAAFFITENARRQAERTGGHLAESNRELSRSLEERAALSRSMEARNAELNEANARISQALGRLELDQAERDFAGGEPDSALLRLASLLRNDPENRPAAERLCSALLWRDWSILNRAPWPGSAKSYAVSFSADGKRILHRQTSGYVSVICPDGGSPGMTIRTEGECVDGVFLPDGIHAALIRREPGGEGVRPLQPRRHLELWNMETGVQAELPAELRGPVPRIGLSRDGRLAAWTDGAVILLVDLPAARILPVRYKAPRDIVTELQFSPDGTFFAAGCTSGSIHWWRTGVPDLAHSFRIQTAIVERIGWSPDNAWISAISADHSTVIVNAATGLPAGRATHQASLMGVTFSPDSRLFATRDAGGFARLWRVPSGDPATPWLRHRDRINDLVFSPDGSLVVTASSDNATCLWNTADGTLHGQPLRHFESCAYPAFTPDGKQLATCSSDGAVRLWDIISGRAESTRLDGADAVSAEFSPSGDRILTAGRDGTVCLWDGEGRRLSKHDAECGTLRFARYSPDGSAVVAAGSLGSALLSPEDGKQLAPALLIPGGVKSAAFSPDATVLAVGGTDGIVRQIRVADGSAAGPEIKIREEIEHLVFTADGRSIIICGGLQRGEVTLHDCRTGAKRQTLAAVNETIRAAVLARDGVQFAVASNDNRVLRFRLEGKPVALGQITHRRTASAADFSRDGTLLLTASWDGQARLWDSATGRPRGNPLPHPGLVRDARFSPSGARLATACGDGTLRVWDTAQQLPVSERLPHGSPVVSVRWSPDGQTLLALGTGGEVRLWPVPDLPDEIPAWLPVVAEAVAGPADSADLVSGIAWMLKYFSLKQERLDSVERDACSRIARRLFTPRTVREVSPWR